MAITSSPLLEREAELALLRGALEEARAGDGTVALIDAEAGAGKSALLAAAAEEAGAAGTRVLRATGAELERDFAFGAIRQLFEPTLARADPDERGRLLAGAAAPAAWVVEGVEEGARPAAGFAALHGIYWLTANLAENGPLLLAVDDLHWVDEPSAQALGYLARRLADLPVALVLATRPREPGAPGAAIEELRAEAATALAPAPLSPAAVAELVRGRLEEADEETCRAFHASSAGNPLYLEELLRSAAAEGTPSPDAVREASIRSLGERVMRRVERLGPGAAELARAMTVLGDRSSAADAARLAGIDAVAAPGLTHGLAGIDILAGEDPVAFVHPLVRRSIYETIPLAEREAAHAAAARQLEAGGAPVERVASHLAVLPPAGSTAVATTLREAAEVALARAAPAAAIPPLRRAIAEGAESPDRAELLFDLGTTEMAVRDPGTVASLSEALECAPPGPLRGRIAVTMIELFVASGEWAAAQGLIEQTVREVEGDPEVTTELAAVRAAAMAYDPRMADEFDRERPEFERLAEGGGWAAAALSALLGATAANRGEVQRRPAELAERALRNGVLDRGAGAWAGAQLLTAWTMVDEIDRALEVCDEVERAGRAQGSLIGVLSGAGFRGYLQSKQGRLAEAEATLRTFVGVAQASGMDLWLTTAYFFYLDAMLERPSLDDLAAGIEAVELQPEFVETNGGAMLLETRGRLRRARGDRAGALPDLRRSTAINRGVRFGPTLSPFRSELALALPPEESAEAQELIDEELALAEATGLPRPTGVALRAAGILAGGDGGLALLSDSVDVLGGTRRGAPTPNPTATSTASPAGGVMRTPPATLAASPAPLELARSQVALGAALRRANRRADARAPLAAGMELAHLCGAVRLVVRADEELRAAGARPRRPALTGVDSLTASELRIARLAAEGRSNAEIAQDLYISRKTVETHLSRAYMKLGLAGQGARRGLPAALASPAAG